MASYFSGIAPHGWLEAREELIVVKGMKYSSTVAIDLSKR